MACAVNICRAAAYIDPEDDVPLWLVASDIADEIKVSCKRFLCHENHVLIYLYCPRAPFTVGVVHINHSGNCTMKLIQWNAYLETCQAA